MELFREEIAIILGKFIPSENLVKLLTVIAMVIFWLIIGKIISLFSKGIINGLYKANLNIDRGNKTLANMIHKVISFVFWFIILILILNELSINIVPVLASAGVFAFAVGFGAQELIKDLISGFFLISEKSFDVGEVIEVYGFKGKILEIGLRRTKLVNWKNEEMSINNGDIRQLVNFSHGNSVAVVELTVAYHTDLSIYRLSTLNDRFDQLKTIYPQIVESPKLIGVSELKDSGIVLRFTAKTLNFKHIEVERAMREIIINYSDENDVKSARLISIAEKH